ncbi:hypothetical protein THAOC_10364 [Thalassiosira oceanica]|uniref:Uncharacterized protein n=1 Tax=Thalassiosira oceanica TaxID=159749 RepID=K0SQ73_THAOC|nr:hypothetical protein THAOC_10364 [Thalassiosira oceanica]|eukprot:EJK68458.1 hypothetical protein THAOC_10364 [Thalassiosira oceanica]
MEVAKGCIPEQNRPPIPILVASAKAVDPAITDDFGLEVERRSTPFNYTANGTPPPSSGVRGDDGRGLSCPWASARAHLPTIQTKHAALRHLLAPPEMITGADTNRRHGIVSALSRRSCRAAGGSRQRAPGYFKVYYLPRRCVLAEPSQRTCDVESPRLDGARKIRGPWPQPPESEDWGRPPRVGEDKGILPYRLALATILAVKWASCGLKAEFWPNFKVHEWGVFCGNVFIGPGDLSTKFHGQKGPKTTPTGPECDRTPDLTSDSTSD